MTRLNKDIKAKILQNAINAAPVTKRLEELEAMKYQLTVDIYDSVTKGHNIAEYAAQLKEIVHKSPFYLGLSESESATDVVERDYIYCAFGGLQDYLYFPDDGKTRYQIKSTLLRFSGDHEFSIKFNAIVQEAQKCEEEKNNLEIDIQTILNSCRTAAQLEKFWPASVNFLEGCEVCAEIKGVPVVLVNDLNAKLGIYA
jgi:hypothetical protein